MLMDPKTMSDSGDSFEKIEFEQSALAATPTSDQESVDLTTSDQHSSGLTTGDQHSSSKSSTTTMSSSTAKTGQSEDLEFELPWMIRKEIVDILNQLTALLSGLAFTADVREMMRKANSDLVTALMNLPVKGGGRPKSFESPESRPDNGLNEVFLCLSEDVKSRILDTLVANQHVALLGADFVSSERKSKLIDQNTDLACELLKLRPRAIPGDSSKDDRLIDPTAKTSESHTTSTANEKELGELDSPKSRPADEVAILKEELEQRMDSMISNVQENVRALKEELATSKEELATLKGEVVVSGSEVTVMKGQVEKLETQNTVLLTDLEESERRLKEQMARSKGEVEMFRVLLDEIDVCRSEITITSELKGIEALLAPGAKARSSKVFICGGISWYLKAYPCVKHGIYYLSVFLNRSPGPDRWSVVATYEALLLSSDVAGSGVVGTVKDHVFKNPDKFLGYGWSNFITVDKLRSGSFIKDDTIKFRIYLSTKNLERNADFE